MAATRYLIVVADDYGIGPETSRGILELAGRGLVTATVLLTNSPHAADAVRAWRQVGAPMEMGWHPCLTMDPPTAGAGRVPSLVGADGCMHPLGTFLARLAAGRIRAGDVARELDAQYDRFVELTGRPPPLVNSHQHVGLFPPVGGVLRRLLLRRGRPLPYLRRVREPATMLAAIPGARVKRSFLTALGQAQVGAQRRAGFPGADWLAGVTDPRWVRDPEFFARWLTRVPGRVVELCCHPGRLDPTVLGRDCRPGDGLQQRRVDEHRLMADPAFDAACRRAGFMRVAPSEWRARAGAARAA
jgi:predicted glycoside hydrolase/deacetylase ChbG (UPF0249 family)